MSGILYHLKHPLLALERICAVTTDVCIVDSFVIDGYNWQQGGRPAIPYIEFYERDELAGQLDNWSGSTVSAVEALIKADGFAQAEVRRVTETSACVSAHRHWRNLPPDVEPAIQVPVLVLIYIEAGVSNQVKRSTSRCGALGPIGQRLRWRWYFLKSTGLAWRLSRAR